LPSAPNSSVRQVSTLADLLRPILGDKATSEALRRALGDNEEVAKALLAARKLAMAGWLESVAGEQVDTADPRLASYLIGKLQNAHEERLHAIFLDRKGHYVRDELMSVGTRSGLGMRVRAIVQRALDLAAHKVILAHNHPSGIARPSPNDRDATARFEMVARAIEIELLDHFIIGGGKVFSMRRGQLI
jgi:DNA repair protein RadC